MKTIAYILAAIGLVTIGAAGAVLFRQAHTPFVQVMPETERVTAFIDGGTPSTHVVRAIAGDSEPRSVAEAPRAAGAMPPAPFSRIANSMEALPVARNELPHGSAYTSAHKSWADITGNSAGLLLFMGMLVFAALIALKWKLDAQRQGAPAESEGIQSLHRQAQSLAGRMEALETILLERGQHGR